MGLVGGRTDVDGIMVGKACTLSDRRLNLVLRIYVSARIRYGTCRGGPRALRPVQSRQSVGKAGGVEQGQDCVVLPNAAVQRTRS